MVQLKKLRNVLIGTGIAAVGAAGTKMAVDYFRNRGEDEPDEPLGQIDKAPEDDIPVTAEQVAFFNIETNSVQSFLDASFGAPQRYTPTRPAKVFDYQDQQYMVIWAYDNEKEKNQMLAFLYTDSGRKMIASVGYTADVTDYNLSGLSSTPFAIEVNGEQITDGMGETEGTDEVDFVPAGS